MPRKKSSNAKKSSEEDDFESCDEYKEDFYQLKHSTASIKFSIESEGIPLKFLETELIKKVRSTDGALCSTDSASIVKIGCNFGRRFYLYRRRDAFQ